MSNLVEIISEMKPEAVLMGIAAADFRFRRIPWDEMRRSENRPTKGESEGDWLERQPFKANVDSVKLRQVYPYRDAESLPGGRWTVRLAYHERWMTGASLEDAHARAVLLRLMVMVNEAEQS